MFGNVSKAPMVASALRLLASALFRFPPLHRTRRLFVPSASTPTNCRLSAVWASAHACRMHISPSASVSFRSAAAILDIRYVSLRRFALRYKEGVVSSGASTLLLLYSPMFVLAAERQKRFDALAAGHRDSVICSDVVGSAINPPTSVFQHTISNPQTKGSQQS